MFLVSSAASDGYSSECMPGEGMLLEYSYWEAVRLEGFGRPLGIATLIAEKEEVKLAVVGLS